MANEASPLEFNLVFSDKQNMISKHICKIKYYSLQTS